ncbi:MAG: hypothetical protein KC931_12350 [Candidatus Omnitrophica bacterium]|nr:hypothetical protein [Candidatus Omnitrophota bacterium]
MPLKNPPHQPSEVIEAPGFNLLARIYFVFPLILAPLSAIWLVLIYFSAFWDNSISVALLMLSPKAMVLQAPFIILASLSSLKFLKNPTVECHSLWIRWGITLGMLVGLYFTLIVLIAEHEFNGDYPWNIYQRAFFLLLVTFGFFILTLPWLSVRFQNFLQRHLILFLATLLIIHLLIGFVYGFEAAIFWPMILVRFAGPWYFATECCLTYSIWRHWIDEDGPDAGWKPIDFYLPSGLVSTFLLSGCASFKIAQDLKATLPPPGDCFIATAAAQGHPSIVHSWEITDEDGRIHRVNRQLLTLKEFEVRLMKSAPRFHAALREVYNRVGPMGARIIRPKLLADLAYFALKPVEWGARLSTKPLVSEDDE